MAVDDVWRETVNRLNRREHPKWESLSWVALRPLISSINDRINRAAPELVDDLRRSWMRAVRERQGLEDADDYQGVVDRSDTECFLVMGDTGEQDASQYVLAPALRAAMDPAGDTAADFLLICSDVIYPSGDINDYAHGFYLPYEDLLRWDPDGTPRPQRIYALPGNHDWYDGLTGFMHTFCGLDRLGPDSYIWRASWRRKLAGLEVLGRMLWRRPSTPLPTRLTTTAEYTSIATLRTEAMGRFDPLTGQPGPYYAIQVKGLLLVCIDGGIGSHGDCEIDADQGRWLLRVSALEQPKILLTGYPLLVNGEWKSCRIRWEAGTPDELPASVNEIVAEPANGYIASIGGDIHNFQYYDVQVGEPAHPVRYLVSGGGGAYISATHPGPGAIAKTVADLHGEAPAVRARNAAIGGPVSTEDPLLRLGPVPDTAVHALIPTPELSLSRFTEQVLPKTWRLIRALLAFVAAAVLGTALAHGVPGFTPGTGPLGRSTATLLAALALIVTALAFRVFVLGPPRVLELDRAGELDAGRRQLYRRGITAFAAVCGFAVPVLAARIGPESWFGYLVCWELLTGLGVLLAMLERYSGWWREPAAGDHGARAAIVAAVALVLVPLLVDRMDVVPFTGSRRWWILLSALCVAVPAGIGWLLRGRRGWRTRSRSIAPLAQLVGAAIFLSTLPGGAPTAVRPPAAISALLVALGLLVLAVVVTALVIALPWLVAVLLGLGLLTWALLASPPSSGPLIAGAAVVVALAGWALLTRSAVRPQRRLARYGALAPSFIAVLLPAALIVLTLVTDRHGDQSGPAAFLRVLTVVVWGLTLTVLGVFGVDTLRRTQPAHYRILATGIGAAAVAIIAWVPLANHWLAAGLVITGVGLILFTVTTSLVYLAFLGGHNLVFDWPAHRDLAERTSYLIDEVQAKQVIEWRQAQGRHEIDDKRLERRAKFVTPSTDKPQGLIQQKVSEFFSTDRPPFSQHFLQLRVRATASPPTVEITPRLVTGDATAGSEPGITISIPLTQPSPDRPRATPVSPL